MIKLVYCITKKAGLTDQEFFDYWKNIHGPIGSQIPRLRRLVQSHRLDVPGDKYQPDYDGMAELWFDDMEALLAAHGVTAAFGYTPDRLLLQSVACTKGSTTLSAPTIGTRQMARAVPRERQGTTGVILA